MKRFGANPRVALALGCATVALFVTTAPALGRILIADGVELDNQLQVTSDAGQVSISGGDMSVSSGDAQAVLAGDNGVSVSSDNGQVTVSGNSVSVSSGQGQVSVSGNQVSINSSSQVSVSSGGDSEGAPIPTMAPLPTMPPLPTFPPFPTPQAFPTMPPFPTFPPIPTPVPLPTAAPNAAPSAGEGTFTLCGGPDPQAEEAIAGLINGHNFSSRLVSRPDGCVDLSIAVSPQSAGTNGRQSVNMSVPVGPHSGGTAGSVSIQIVTENGTTRVSIGAGR